MGTTVARRFAAGTAIILGVSFGSVGSADAQSGPSGPSTTRPATATTRPASGTGVGSTGGTGGARLPDTGGAGLPLALSAAAVTVVLGSRRLSSRAHA